MNIETPIKKDYRDPEKEELNKLLQFMVEQEGSDLHIKPKVKAKVRINGDIEEIESSKEYTKEETLQLAKEMLRTEFEDLIEQKNIDFTYTIEENEDFRFRVNIFFQKDGVSLVMRTIPTKIYSLEELDLPEGLYEIPKKSHGIVLVTGVTGSGKSTTMAALINEINEKQKKHIITIEDPIEFIHQDKMSIINQRSIGQDAVSFSNALRAALREDPDTILIGEIRDVETVEMALHAAETGHIVFATLHTPNSAESIKRIVGMFPPEEQTRIRMVLSSSIGAIVSQRLVKTIEGGRTPAVELLLDTPRIKQLILEDRDDEIEATLDAFKVEYKTHSFDEHLFQLEKKGVITKENALKTSTNPDNLNLKFRGIGLSSDEDTEGVDTSKSTGLKLKLGN